MSGWVDGDCVKDIQIHLSHWISIAKVFLIKPWPDDNEHSMRLFIAVMIQFLYRRISQFPQFEHANNSLSFDNIFLISCASK